MSVTGHVLRVHERLYKATDGRVGHKMLGVPCLLLRSTGRRSGQTRTNGLVYARDGGDYLVVASNGGGGKGPGWDRNVKGKPDVEGQGGRGRQKATARGVEVAAPAYNPVWQVGNEKNHRRYTGD